LSRPTTCRLLSFLVLADELSRDSRLDSATYRVAYLQHAHASGTHPSERDVCWIEIVIARRPTNWLDELKGERRRFDQGQT